MNKSVEERDWQVGKSLVKCLQHILTNEISADVTFNIKSSSSDPEATRVSAHQLILSARSPVFEAMFSGKFAESSDEVEIVDTDVDSFKDMLRYIYTDDVELKGNNTVQILYLARKYVLEDLTMKCSEYLENDLRPNNICDIMKYSIQDGGNEEVVKRCLNVCAANTAAVLTSDGFRDMSDEALLTLLKNDFLDPTQEEAIIEACIGWAEIRKQSESERRDLREILGDCIYEIRFFQLMPEVLAKIVGSSPLLTDTEKYSLVFGSLTKESIYGEKLRDLGFNTYSRCYTYDCAAQYTVASSNQQFQYIGEETIHLTVTKTCALLGVSVFSGTQGSQHAVNIELREDTSDVADFKIQSTFTSQRPELVPFFFKEKAQLLPEKRYILKATPPSGTNCYFPTSTNYTYNFIPPFPGSISFQVRNYSASQPATGAYLQYMKVFHLAVSLV